MLASHGETVQMAVLEASHTPRILIIVEIVRIIHLLDGLNALGQKAAHTAMLPLALLAETTSWRATFAYDMSPLVALVAHCPLWAFITPVGG